MIVITTFDGVDGAPLDNLCVEVDEELDSLLRCSNIKFLSPEPFQELLSPGPKGYKFAGNSF